MDLVKILEDHYFEKLSLVNFDLQLLQIVFCLQVRI